MISSASLLIVIAVGGIMRDTVPPEAVVVRVRELIATDVQRGADELVLEWGRLPPMPSDAATAPLGISGRGHGGWFVVTLDPPGDRPVAVMVRAGVRRLMPVAARALRVGTTITAGDLSWAYRVDWNTGADTTAIANPLGWEVRRGIDAGDLLGEPLVRAPRLVHSGEVVTFIWQRGTVRMERVAVAQGSARLGEVIRAQVGDVRLTGRVIGEGMALIEEREE